MGGRSQVPVDQSLRSGRLDPCSGNTAVELLAAAGKYQAYSRLRKKEDPHPLLLPQAGEGAVPCGKQTACKSPLPLAGEGWVRVFFLLSDMHGVVRRTIALPRYSSRQDRLNLYLRHTHLGTASTG